MEIAHFTSPFFAAGKLFLFIYVAGLIGAKKGGQP